MNKHDFISWKKGFEAARQAEQKLILHEEVNCKRSIQLALSLINTSRRMGMWDRKRKDRLREAGVEDVRQKWKRLKENAAR